MMEEGVPAPHGGGRSVSPRSKIASTRRVFRAVRHMNQRANKFRFEMLIEDLRLKTPDDAQVAVEWVRGTRRSRTKETRPLTTRTGGFCSWADANPLTLSVTLFGNAPGLGALSRSGSGLDRSASQNSMTLSKMGSGKGLSSTRRADYAPPEMDSPEANGHQYAAKEARIEILDVKRKGGQGGTLLAEGKFDLSHHAGAVYPNFHRVTVPLTKSLDGQAKITFLLSCIAVTSESNEQAGPAFLLGKNAVAASPPVARPPRQQKSMATEKSKSEKGVAPTTTSEDEHESGNSATSHVSRTYSVANRLGQSDEEEELAARDFHTASFGGAMASTRRRSSVKRGSKDGTAEVGLVGVPDVAMTAALAIRQGGGGGGEVAEIQNVLMERIKMLEKESIEKDTHINEIKEKERADQKLFEEVLANERNMAAAMESKLKAQLNDRDDQVTKLLKQLEDMHDALDRAQKQNVLQREDYDSRRRRSSVGGERRASVSAAQPGSGPTQIYGSSSPVVVALREEIKNLKKRVKDATSQTAAYHQALDLESGKRNKMLLDIEKKYHAQKKSWSFQKSSLELQLTELKQTSEQLEQTVAQEREMRKDAQQRLAGMRQQLGNNLGDSYLAEQANRELQELMKTRDDVMNKRADEERRYTQQVAMLNTVAGQQQEEMAMERQHFETERKTLRNRILELENEMASLPRPSVVQRLNAAETATELQSQLAELQQQGREQGIVANTAGGAADGYHSHAATPPGGGNSGGRLGDPRTALGLAQRLVELEDDLIKTKLALAESETMRDLQIDKTRKRNVILREQIKEYNHLVSDLEMQITDLKTKKKNAMVLKLGKLKSSKSIAHSVNHPAMNEEYEDFAAFTPAPNRSFHAAAAPAPVEQPVAAQGAGRREKRSRTWRGGD